MSEPPAILLLTSPIPLKLPEDARKNDEQEKYVLREPSLTIK
jgi:hypothetical protein